MNTFIRLFVFFVTNLIIFACSVESIEDNIKERNYSPNELAVHTPQSYTSFSVTPLMLKRFLNLFSVGKNPELIEPIVEKGDTLAYYVQYANNKGWDIIAADTRVAPVLAMSECNQLSLEQNPDQTYSAIGGMLEFVKDIKKDTFSKKNSIWAFLFPNRPYSKNRPISLPTTNFYNTKSGLRGFGQGMWVAVDTTIRYNTTSSPKLTVTNWYQSNPFNKYVRKKNGQHCKVGCAPVAAAQLIYHYYHNNPGYYRIPSKADTLCVPVTFRDSTLTAWSSLVTSDIILYDCDTTSVFLSWIAEDMNASFDVSQTHADWSDQVRVLNKYFNYRVGFNVGHNNSGQQNQFCDTLVSSIFAGSPVYIASNDYYGDGHVFLIDQCSLSSQEYVIRYIFDPYHNITEYEYYNYPSWYFDWPNNYDPYKDTAEFEESMELSNYLYVKMNWGFRKNTQTNTNYNNIQFPLRTRSYSIGENGSYLSNEQIVLRWIVSNGDFSGVLHWAHHFSRNDNN